MRKAVVSSLAAVFLLVAPAGAASARTFTFFGSGWGHGLGLSQWGAYGLALDGWTAGKILTHFYSHSKVARAESSPARLRIGLAQDRARYHLHAAKGAVDLRLGNAKRGDLVASIPSGETWTVRVAGSKYKILDANGDPVGDPVGGTATNLYANYERNTALVKIAEAGHTYNRGWIEFNITGCTDGCTMRLVLSIRPQDYLYGLSEVPSSWPRPALQAQAIAARTYAFRRVQTDGQHRPGCNCALVASSADQVYGGWDKEGALDGARWVGAVDATDGKVLVYQSQLIQAFYTSSSGGFTEDNENVWGGTPIAYLRGVCDPGDYTSANPNAVWQVSMTTKQVTGRLGLGVGAVRKFTNVKRGVSGRITSVTVKGEKGSATIGGDRLRAALGLNDDRVWINSNRQVIGEIRQKYDSTNCKPGLPTSKRTKVAGGQRQRFNRSTIYYRSDVGAHVVGGAVLNTYLAEGGPSGHLGFPTTDVRTLTDGSRRARFEHGVITCDAGSCTVAAT
jgi:stage II sporulation protein D